MTLKVHLLVKKKKNSLIHYGKIIILNSRLSDDREVGQVFILDTYIVVVFLWIFGILLRKHNS